MFEVGCGLSVASLDGPAVGHHVDVAVTHGNHRFDGDTHGRLQHRTVTAPAIVGNLRIFVHLATDTMTGKFTYDAIPFGFAMFLDRTADITQVITRNSCLDAEIETLLRGLQQLLDFLADFAYTERIG